MQPNKRTPNQLFGSQVRYEVPEYQRAYVWDEYSQWEPLWEDITELTDTRLNDPEQKVVPHFLGAVVLNQHPNAAGSLEIREIVDGQQRLITLQVLLKAVSLAMDSFDLNECVARLNSLTYNPPAFWDNDETNKFKVWPSILDRKSFETAFGIANGTDIQRRRKDKPKIELARDYFEGKTKQWLHDKEDKHRSGELLESTLRQYLEFVVIDLADEDDPNLIFETMNARGTPLLESDKIKNRISYELISKKQKFNWPFDSSTVNEFWYENTGSGHNQRPRVDQYFNYWLTLRLVENVKVRSEFNDFTRYLKGRQQEDISTVLTDINNISENYRFIETLEATKIYENDVVSVLERFLKFRDIFSAGAITPLLLYLIEKCDQVEQLTQSLNILESYLVRRSLCNRTTRAYSEIFVELITRLNNVDTPSLFAFVIEKHLSNNKMPARVWPNDTELMEYLTANPLYGRVRQSRINYVLRRVEDYYRKNTAEELVSNSESKLEIEHVMPVSWHENWPLDVESDLIDEDRNLLSEKRDRMLNTIGNLTLLTAKLNQDVSNGPWHQKKQALNKQSVLKINWHLCNDDILPKWNEETIRSRSVRLFEVCKEIWPYANDD